MSKKGLDPVVECSECVDGADQENSHHVHQGIEPSCSSGLLKRPDGPTSRSSEAVSYRRKRKGSRLSLTSLFSLSSLNGHDWQNRERNRDSDVELGQDETNNEQSGYLLLGYEDDDECLELVGVKKQPRGSRIRECPLCCMRQPSSNFPRLLCCQHRSCRLCLMQYVEMEIMENRVEVSCPECAAHLHPTDIRNLVGGRAALIEKYEQFSLRRYLMTECDTRWCPAPDCGYAVIASSCAACPQLKCGRESCGTLFCYHCKGVWHESQTCDEARRQRGTPTFRTTRRITSASVDIQLKPGDIKACPRCHTFIVKMDDGSCNHMVCAMCSVEFCWLCLKEISDLHYLSPTGCTFWGKKPWTRKKKLLWQLGTLIGAPVGIALIAGLSVPGIIFGVPVFVGRKVHQRLLHHAKARRRLLTAACVAGSFLVSPVLAVMAVGVGVPIMLAYVYGVVPLSLCRNGGCGLSEPSTGADALDEEELWAGAIGHGKSQLLCEMDKQPDASSLAAGLSLQSGISSATQHHVRLTVNPDIRRRPSVESGVNSLGDRCNYEEASTRAMAGSHYHYDDKSVHTIYSGHEVISYSDELASTKALAGSVLDSKSLSESLGTRVLPTQHEQNDFDQMMLLTDEPSGSGISRCNAIGPQVVSSSAYHEPREEVDPFKIRSLLDNMKQMVAVEQAHERPYESAGSSRSAPLNRFLRSASGRSLSATAVQSPDSASSGAPKRSRWTLQSLFSEKGRKK